MMAGEPEHLYASRFMMDRINFTRKHNVSYHIVMHQITPRKEKQDGNYPPPSLYNIKGGGTVADSTDNVISVWRPNRGSNPNDTSVIIRSDKIKKQKLVGIPTEIEIDFDRKKNRYISKDGYDYFDGGVKQNGIASYSKINLHQDIEPMQIYNPNKFYESTKPPF
jgi:twinkle protein